MAIMAGDVGSSSLTMIMNVFKCKNVLLCLIGRLGCVDVKTERFPLLACEQTFLLSEN